MMKDYVSIAFSVLVLLTFSGEGLQASIKEVPTPTDYTEQHRLQFHFSVPAGWLNDPNGLVYYDGYYHLFYQHYPDATVWGPMHWGHARTRDLIHWENLPIAIYPTQLGNIFSGSAIIDTNNITGFTQDINSPALIAIYTLAGNNQQQALAYSNDGHADQFTQYANNPIIPNQDRVDFRDPSVFIWSDNAAKLVLAAGDRLLFYTSTNLKDWTLLSQFGADPNQGDKEAVWECPSLNLIPDDDGNIHHVVLISLNKAERGSATQYYVGQFDGTQYTNSNPAETVLWNDYGPDNYATIPFNSEPKGRNIQIGWMSNWLYADRIPTSTWRGQTTLPRELRAKRINDVIRITQYPVEEVNLLRNVSLGYTIPEPIILKGTASIDLTELAAIRGLPLLDLDLVFDRNTADNGEIGVRFENSLNEFIDLHYSIGDNSYVLIRTASGKVDFSDRFLMPTRFPRVSSSPEITLRVLLDVSAVELFADGGLNVLTGLFFPNEDFTVAKVYTNTQNPDQEVILRSASIYPLHSIWN